MSRNPFINKGNILAKLHLSTNKPVTESNYESKNTRNI